MRTRFSSVLAAAAGLAALACSDVTAPGRITALPRALTGAEQRLIVADNRFAFSLLRQLASETHDTLENLFVSPLSVAMALAMTYNGAAGTTETGMRQTLELGDMTTADVNESYRSLIALLRNLDRQVRFTIANSIWYRPEFIVEPAFLDANRTFYDARVEALDFASPTAAPTINNWVNQQTNGLIPTIVEDPIPRDDVMYLINAIYFKGNWTQQFDKALTRPAAFHLADGSTVDVPTMTHGEEVRVRASWEPSVTVGDLPYGGQAFSLTVVVPHDATSIDAFVAGLTQAQWDGWIAALDSTKSHVYLPKFKLTNDLSLVSTLKAMGMEIAFDCELPDMADFTRMTPQPACLSSVKHRTYVDVNEEGTEAAAVTSVGVQLTSLPPSVTVDRPFVFALRENLSGTILFLGVIRNPAAS